MAKARKTHKTGKTKLHKGRKVNEYSDGCWRYDGSGSLAIRSPSWNSITKENAVAMQRRGQDVREEKKQAAIMRRAREHLSLEASARVRVPDDVAAEAAAEIYMEVFERDNSLRDRVLTYERIGRDAGFVDRQISGGPQAIQININVSEKAIAGIEEEDLILDAIYKDLDEKF